MVINPRGRLPPVEARAQQHVGYARGEGQPPHAQHHVQLGRGVHEGSAAATWAWEGVSMDTRMGV